MRIEDLRSKGLILYEVISGSKAYGTNKPTSDTDIRGVYLAPLEDVLGFNYQAQVADDKNDVVFYELKRFLELIEKQNPNILEMLYIPEDCVVYKHPLMDDILAHRHQFLTKTCCNSFAGYAVSQIKKAKGLNKKINYPEPVMRKSPLDFCYFMVNEKSIPAREYLTERGYDQSFCGLVALDHMRFTYAVYYDRAGQLNAKHGTQIPTLAKFKGIIQSEEDSNDVSLSALPLEYPHFPIAHMQFNKDAYQVHCRIYLDYQNWVANRNPDRYQVTIDNGNDYDCYLESETEFLVYGKGWVRFNNVTETDLIGTINRDTRRLEWNNYTERFDKEFSGKLYTYENRYTRFSVTDNHKLFVKDAARSKKNGFTTNSCSGDWYLESCEDFFNGKKSYKHVVVATDNYRIDYGITDRYLKLIGLYISEGSLYKNGSGTIKGISLSQVKSGRFSEIITEMAYSEMNHYKFERKGRIENTYNLIDEGLANLVKGECGEYAENKTLPPYYLKLSKRQVGILFDAMMSGDGHKHAKGHSVYYTCSELLADQLHTMLTLNGLNTQVYTVPFDGKKTMYQVFVSKHSNLTKCINKNSDREFGWKIRNVENERVVCFSVPSGLLITRNKKKLAFQANCKNMMHCIRLIRVAKEIATEGVVKVRRPDRDELMLIRNGVMEYETLLAEAEQAIGQLDNLYAACDLPDSVDSEFMSQLLIALRKNIYKL